MEALPLSAARAACGVARPEVVKKRLDDIFKKLSAAPSARLSRNGHRIYFPYDQVEEMASKGVENTDEIEKSIQMALDEIGYEILDYKKGLAAKAGTGGRNPTKIGKLLVMLKKQRPDYKETIEYWQHQFENDPIRTMSRQVNVSLVFSKHPYDIAGMSTNRGWTSCMNLSDGENKEYVTTDIKHGTFIVYMIRAEDTNIEKPIARVLVKPMVNTKNASDIIYYPDIVYGTVGNSPRFNEVVKKILGSVQKINIGKYELDSSLYDDSIDGIKKLPRKEEIRTARHVKEVLTLLSVPVEYITVHPDLSVSSRQSVILGSLGEGSTELPIQFKKVSGNFYCSSDMRTLQGCPEEVTGDFITNNAQLVSLEGGPKRVGKDYYCLHAGLTSLEGAPDTVGGTFVCEDNRLKSLKDGPRVVQGDYNCRKNPLESLKEFSTSVGGDLYVPADVLRKMTDEEEIELRKQSDIGGAIRT
jgi:hypothetical protein